MLRPCRLDPPDVPQHVVLRGTNHVPCFLHVEARLDYLEKVRTAALRNHCAVHAYVLMDNHVHLLATQSESGAVAGMMQMLHRRHRQHSSGLHRCGRVWWEGHYESRPVNAETDLLKCQRYIELNPVRAWVVGEPCAYRWSSHGANAHGDEDALLTPHPVYMRLGASAPDRQAAYRALFAQVWSDDDDDRIRAYLQHERVLGAHAFQARVGRELSRFTQVWAAHRPWRIVERVSRTDLDLAL